MQQQQSYCSGSYGMSAQLMVTLIFQAHCCSSFKAVADLVMAAALVLVLLFSAQSGKAQQHLTGLLWLADILAGYFQGKLEALSEAIGEQSGNNSEEEEPEAMETSEGGQAGVKVMGAPWVYSLQQVVACMNQLGLGVSCLPCSKRNRQAYSTGACVVSIAYPSFALT